MASRIRRHIEQQSERTLFLSIVGSLLVIIFLIFYGVPLLSKFALMLSNSKASTTNATTGNSPSFIAAPVLNDTFTATNSATVSISGSAIKNQDIKLYVNGTFAGDKQVDDNGTFTFDNVVLTAGNNDIKAQATTNNNVTSDYSNDLQISYSNKGPTLTVNTPSDNQTFSGGNSKTLQIQGTTDAECKVTVNNFWAIVDGQGNFTYSMQLQNGDNNLTIVSTDPAGNITTVQRKVTYNP
ncbi:MAG TPA: hypothetical protein VMR41_00690 [Patescibacteria group bacterium]|nr:hypothetical protein [Patescibacteria group bacterium]